MRSTNSADYLANHLAEVPVMFSSQHARTTFASVPSAALRRLPRRTESHARCPRAGYGTTLTTLHKLHDAEVKELLGIPEEHETMASFRSASLGKFGLPPRQPVERVVRWDRWGRPDRPRNRSVNV